MSASDELSLNLTDFVAHSPSGQFIYIPTRQPWPAGSVDARVREWPKNAKTGKVERPSVWLNRNFAVEQITWAPGEPMLIANKLYHAGGSIHHQFAHVFNEYRPPEAVRGDANDVAPWLDHLKLIYQSEWRHISLYMAHLVQRPSIKRNHAILLGGPPGIGKDTILEPLRTALGSWNCADISPGHLVQQFNSWAKSLAIFISEARDLGETDRYAFYEHSKTYLAAPPEVVLVNEKHIRAHYVLNVAGVFITTNHKAGGLYLPPDDRRHYVAYSTISKDEFSLAYFRRLWEWYGLGGLNNVAAYLRELDITEFDPKAPPPRTAAFNAIVAANSDPGEGELADALDKAGRPDATTLEAIANNATALGLDELARELSDRKGRRQLPHRLERAGYETVRNPDAADGLWRIQNRRQAVYGRRGASIADQLRAARALQ